MVQVVTCHNSDLLCPDIRSHSEESLKSKTCFCSPNRRDLLWGPTSLLFSGYRAFFPWDKAAGNVRRTTHLHLVPRLRMDGAVPPLPLDATHGNDFIFSSVSSVYFTRSCRLGKLVWNDKWKKAGKFV
jgi:hypothetical protein